MVANANYLASVLVLTDTNSVERGTPRPDNTGYWTFLRAFNLRDPLDLHPLPAERCFCFQGTARSRIDMVACHIGAKIPTTVGAGPSCPTTTFPSSLLSHT